MVENHPIYSSNYLRRNRLTGNSRRMRRIVRELKELTRLIPDIPEDDPTDHMRKALAIHWVNSAINNVTAANNQMLVARDGLRALRKMQDK